jgi:hypothetical protein
VDDARIVELAREAGLSLGMYPFPILSDKGNGKMGFVQPTELTWYGQKIVEFARLVEKEVKSRPT